MNINNKKIDLHLHSSCSDGLFTPTQLAQKLAAAGLEAFALTDHDTIAGLDEAAQAAEEVRLEFVPGIEISVVEETSEFHILGYYPVNMMQMEEKLAELREQRFIRMEKTINLLKMAGINITIPEVLTEAGQAAPGRMHLARLMLRKKYVHSVDEAFNQYLGFKKTAYVMRKTFSLPETIKMLVDCQAVPVFAHPGDQGLAILKTLIPLGLMGVEIFHPDHNSRQVRQALQLATELKLAITGGSDFHGSTDLHSPYPVERAIDHAYLMQLKDIKRVHENG